MKLKIIQLLALLFISSPLFSQDEIESKWKNSGNAVFLVNQSSFSNWTSGGQSSISGTLKIDYNFNYADNGWDWDTKLISNFGLNKISGSEFLKKTDDRIEVNSVLGKKFKLKPKDIIYIPPTKLVKLNRVISLLLPQTDLFRSYNPIIQEGMKASSTDQTE